MDLGEASTISDINIYKDRSKHLIGLSKSTYLDKILKQFCENGFLPMLQGYLDKILNWFKIYESKKGFLPMLHGTTLSKTQSPAIDKDRKAMNKIPYASAIDPIMYGMLCTRPDVAHAISLTSRYQFDLSLEHWIVVKNILKYLRRTKDMFLVYGDE
jgi:hypothetical protein